MWTGVKIDLRTGEKSWFCEGNPRGSHELVSKLADTAQTYCKKAHNVARAILQILPMEADEVAREAYLASKKAEEAAWIAIAQKAKRDDIEGAYNRLLI